MDEADLAEQREEMMRADALGRRRVEGPPACGACLYCGEPVRGSLRWCDRDCRDDWEREQRASLMRPD